MVKLATFSLKEWRTFALREQQVVLPTGPLLPEPVRSAGAVKVLAVFAVVVAHRFGALLLGLFVKQAKAEGLLYLLLSVVLRLPVALIRRQVKARV